MSFYEIIEKYKNFDFDKYYANVRETDVLNSMSKHKLDDFDLLNLLSPVAFNHIEKLAQKSRELTLSNFGKTILLFTPMYIANYCINKCAYCGFNCSNKISRMQLTLEEIEKEAKEIAKTGLKHILVLTGESPVHTKLEYIIDAVKLLKKYFDSVAIEIYPLSQEDYERVIEAGADKLTVYQETYNEAIYDKVHLAGPKKDYKFRLNTPERAAKARINAVNFGALLGLDDWRKDFFYTCLHAKYIQEKYPDVEVGVSMPRIRPHEGSFTDIFDVTDKDIVQMLVASRIFIPRATITVTTRENKEFRNNLLRLGVTNMSAGVTTKVGGHSSDKSEAQFEIADSRTVENMQQFLNKNGYQAVFKDWYVI